jgi:uridine kinase
VIAVAQGTTLLELAERYQDRYEHDIVLARADGKLIELASTINKNCTVEFYTTASKCGIDTYRRSATLLMLKAFYEVCGKSNIDRICVMNSVSKGYYCKLYGKVEVNAELLKKVEHNMRQMVACNHTIKKYSLDINEAKDRFKRHGMDDKVKLFKYRRTSSVNVYNLNGFEDYFYGYMVPSTKYLKYFSMHLYDEGFVIQLPTKEAPNVVQEFRPQNKVFSVLKETANWNEMLEVDTVGALNDAIASSDIEDLILVHEALQEKKIGDIAEQIKERGNIKYVMIAGPSSSGKTTFSHRLSIQLRAIGLKPHTIAVDNYFVERDKTPRDENGDYNYEILEALDVEQFNKDMIALGNGETVYMPTYNFITGKREYKGNKLKLGKEDVLVIEGIHCLNDKLSYALNKDNKFKIYISALTQLNIDEHNRIPTTDGRLLRRIVRDARTRGTSAKETISRWPSVRNGEENHIFPFQEEADAMFNSALIYELSVIKQYAEPLLYQIPKNCPEYDEANRLIKFLSYFMGVSSERIPTNSLIREFVGGGCFNL